MKKQPLSEGDSLKLLVQALAEAENTPLNKLRNGSATSWIRAGAVGAAEE